MASHVRSSLQQVIDTLLWVQATDEEQLSVALSRLPWNERRNFLTRIQDAVYTSHSHVTSSAAVEATYLDSPAFRQEPPSQRSVGDMCPLGAWRDLGATSNLSSSGTKLLNMHEHAICGLPIFLTCHLRSMRLFWAALFETLVSFGSIPILTGEYQLSSWHVLTTLVILQPVDLCWNEAWSTTKPVRQMLGRSISLVIAMFKNLH